MRWTRRNIWKGIRAAAIWGTVAAVGASPAAAVVTRPQPDGFQPQLRGDAPLIVRDAPDGYQPQVRGAEVVGAEASRGGMERNDVELAFALAIALASAGAVALIVARGGLRAASLG